MAAAGGASVPVLTDPRHEAPASRRRVEPAAPAPAGPAAPALSAGAAVLTSLAAGACAGALAKTTIAPLDRAKINFQASETPYSFRAALDFLVRSVRAEGVTSLWRGNSATMARIIPYAAIQFTAHEQWKRVLGVDTPAEAKKHKVRHLVAGSLAGVTSQSATYPLDLARARMAVTSSHTYPTIGAVFQLVAREEGLRTLYRGYGATVLGVVPYAGVSFFMYDTLKRKYLEHFGKQQSSILNVVFGGAAGALGQTASYPLDIVRRRMQTARRRSDGSYPYANIMVALRDVYRAEGWRGFFKGLSMNWVKGPVAVGISFATYDKIKTTLREMALTLQ